MNEAVPIPTTLPDLAAYYPRADWVWIGVQLFALAVPLAFLFAGLSPRLRNTCARVARGSRYGTIVLFACAYLALATLVALPVGYFADLVFVRAWNGPTPATPQWLVSQAGGLLEAFVLAAALVWIPYAIIARAPRLWWAVSAAVFVPLIAVGLIVFQLLLTPLWAHYHSLDDPALAAKYEALAERCGIARLPIVVGGNDSTVIGMGPFLRLVLAEDHELTADEQTVQFAHELKHYVLDGWKGIGIVAVLVLTGFWVVDILGRAMLRRFEKPLGFSNLGDPASIPLAVFILSASWLFVGLPVFNAVQRHVELEADRFALELTHENRAQALLQAHYATYKLNEYYWFYRVWRANHPSQADRVRLANSYRPWSSGAPPVYERVCRRSQSDAP
jgi:STE24 endopeptidase